MKLNESTDVKELNDAQVKQAIKDRVLSKMRSYDFFKTSGDAMLFLFAG